MSFWGAAPSPAPGLKTRAKTFGPNKNGPRLRIPRGGGCFYWVGD